MNTIDEAKKAGIGIIYILIIIGVIKYFKLSFWAVYGLLMVTRVLFMYFIQKDLTIKNIFRSAVYLLILMYFMKWLGGYGIAGFILSILLISGLILGYRWKQYIKAKQHIERMIWGKPLKDFKGKPPKLKFEW